MKNLFCFGIAVISAFGFNACGRTSAESTSHSTFIDRDNGYGWYHVSLRASDGTNIKIDYQVHGFGRSGYVADPLWVNVERDGLSSNAQARALIMYGSGTQDPLVTQDLRRVGESKFSAAIKTELYVESSGYPYQIAVVVDGEWLKDPVSGKSNFSFKLAR